MGQTTLFRSLRTMMLTLCATLLGFWAMAQDGGGTGGGASISVSTSKTTTSENWYASPWVWVVGAAVFILLLVALLNNRGGNASAKAD